MNIKKILEYQKVDLENYKLETSLKQSEPAQRYSKATVAKKANAEEVQKCVRDADEVVALVERFRQAYDKIEAEMNGLADVLDTFEEPREIDLYEKKIEQYKKELQSIEREVGKQTKRIDECSVKGIDSLNTIAKCNRAIADSKAKVEELKRAMHSDVKANMKILNDLKAGLDPSLIKKYDEIRRNHRMPVLVSASSNCRACNGCGMDLPSNITSALEADEIVDCPNCTRLIYRNVT